MTITVAISPPWSVPGLIAVAEGTTLAFVVTATAASSAQAWSLDADLLFGGSGPAGQATTLTKAATVAGADDMVLDPCQRSFIRFEVERRLLGATTASSPTRAMTASTVGTAASR